MSAMPVSLPGAAALPLDLVVSGDGVGAVRCGAVLGKLVLTLMMSVLSA